MPSLTWLSPTSAWLISQCPASASPADAFPALGAGNDAGSLAHEAVRQWLTSGSWHFDTAGQSLAKEFDLAAKAAGLRVASVERGVLTRARLRAAAPMLAEALGDADDSALECEVTLKDPAIGLRGRADILITAGSTAVIDLKTSTHEAAEPSSQIRQQLLLYAHLFRAREGRLPERLEVLSLARGRTAVSFTGEDVETAVGEVTRARLAAGAAATPSALACRFCRRRLECAAHWDLQQAVRPDGVEGVVDKITVASTGLVGVRMDPDVWVTQLRPDQLPPGLRPGHHIRLIGLRHLAASSAEWRATARTQGIVTIPPGWR